MNPVHPTPMPRTGHIKKDLMSASPTDSSPMSKLPPTPAKRPIPLPRLSGISRTDGRNILATLTRRPSSVSPAASASEVEEKVTIEKDLEDTQDLFRTITFPSPLTEEKLNLTFPTEKDPQKLHDGNETPFDIGPRESTPSPEPPFYPPPPLPDESVYDEVHSLPGSRGSPWFTVAPRPFSQPISLKQSYSVEDDFGDVAYSGSNPSASIYNSSLSSWVDSPAYDTEESIYDVALGSPSSADGGSSQAGDNSSESESLALTPKKLSLLRCDSWSFYDTVECASQPEKSGEQESDAAERLGRVKLLSASEHIPEEYENVVIVTPRSTVSSDKANPFNFTSNLSARLSSQSSEGMVPNTPTFLDRIPLLIPSPQILPTSLSDASLSSSQMDNLDSVSLRGSHASSPSRRVTPSVIMEFDPLFDGAKPGQQSTSVNRSSEIFKSTIDEESPYGKINKAQSSKFLHGLQHKVDAIEEESSDADAGGKSSSVPNISHSAVGDSAPKPTLPNFHPKPPRKYRRQRPPENVGGSEETVAAKGRSDETPVLNTRDSHQPPPRPPPPPIRTDSMALSEAAEPEVVDTQEQKEFGSSSSIKLQRSTFGRWSGMKKAMKFLNGSGERSAKSSNLGSGDTSASAKQSFFYKDAVSSSRSQSSSPETGRETQFRVNHSVHHGGLMYQLSSGAAGVVTNSSWSGAQMRRFSLSMGKLSWWKDSIGVGPSSCLPLERLTYISVAPDRPNPSTDGEVLSCFELGVIGGKLSLIGRHVGGGAVPSHSLLLGSVSSSERRLWMQKLLESVVPLSCFPNFAMKDFTRAGCAYVKVGISGKWDKGWLLLHQRMFFYYLAGSSSTKEENLQQARCIKVTKEDDGGASCILLDLQGGRALYIQPISIEGSPGGGSKFIGSKIAINGWKSALRSAAFQSGPAIVEQLLTLENVPVIVDKCLNFVYTHGGMSEGIYRRNGSNSSVSKLLTAFQRNAWDVQLTRNDFSEYDVACVLKRFFRDLPEPLLTNSLHEEFCEIAAGTSSREEKIKPYRSLLEKLPSVNYVTLRRLLAHLNYVHSQHERNLMPVENLSAIWGPTLMHVERNDSLVWSRRESEVVTDLVYMFHTLFDVTPEEEEREKQMKEVLERHFIAASVSPASSSCTSPTQPLTAGQEGARAFPGAWMPPSGDLKVWVHILSLLPSKQKEKANQCVHVTLSPQKVSNQLVLELCEQLGLKGPENWCIEEHVLGGTLTRPLHPKERVLNAVLRWGYWDDSDRKDNYLALAPNALFSEIAPLVKAKPPITVNGELRFADSRSKSFKTYMFEFSQAKLSYYKDKRGSVKLGEWKVEDILWYLGHEKKRNPMSRWSITFIDKSKKATRAKETPFFGNTLAGTSVEQMLRWTAALLVAEHPEGLSFPLSPDLM